MPEKYTQPTRPAPPKTASTQSERRITVHRIEIPREIKIAIGARIDAERTAQSNR